MIESDESDLGDAVPLSRLPVGAVATIVAVDGSGPEGARILDLGFLPRTRIEVLRRAPLGDPTAFRLRGTQLCLRRREADRIRARVDPPDCSS
jgi:ferrous iron transport protein A